MKHNFEERKQNRLDHYADQATKNDKLSDELNNRAHEISSFIPFGQPILVGHHSEKRHRCDLDRIHNLHGKSIEASKKADHYRDKADAAENNQAIFSDDPEAVQKLAKKIEELKKLQVFMKEANKCIRKKNLQGFLKLADATEQQWQKLTTPDFMGRVGFASCQLTNNNQNITRLKKRLIELRKAVSRTTDEYTIKGVRIVENVEANRLQLFFQDIPAEEVRTRLKKQEFHWCRSEGAWQRHLNNAGLYAVKQFLNSL